MSRSTHRSVRESALYSQQIKEFGETKLLDEALEGVVWALSTKPEYFEPIPGTTLRFVRTIEFERENTGLMPLKIWFRILDDNAVELLSVTADSYEFESDKELTAKT
jgi:hypothetical protein